MASAPHVPSISIERSVTITSGIYRLECRVDGKTYVGQSSNLRARGRQHAYLLSHQRHFNPHLQSAFNLYGADNFVFSVIETCASDRLTEREQFHMTALQKSGVPLYNAKPAGPSGSLGIPQTEIQKLRHSRSKGGRPIFMTNEMTGEITRYEHVGALWKANPNFQRAHIYSCLHGTRYSHNGFVFDYDPEVASVTPQVQSGRRPGSDHRSRAIIATDEQGSTRFAYAQDIKKAGFSLSAVYECLAGKKSDYRGLTWSYEDGQPHRGAASKHLKGPRRHGGSKTVIATDPSTGQTFRFEYLIAAAEHFGCAHQNIYAAIKRGGTCAGLRWHFAEKETPP